MVLIIDAPGVGDYFDSKAGQKGIDPETFEGLYLGYTGVVEDMGAVPMSREAYANSMAFEPTAGVSVLHLDIHMLFPDLT